MSSESLDKVLLLFSGSALNRLCCVLLLKRGVLNSLSAFAFPWVTSDFSRAALDCSPLGIQRVTAFRFAFPSTTGTLDCSCSPQEGARSVLPPASPSLEGLNQTPSLPSSAMEIMTEADEDAD